MQKLKVLITAGPTRESFDLVRFLSNRSTGKLGVELAKTFLKNKHQVTLLHGPIEVPEDLKAKKITYESVDELAQKAKREIKKHDVLLMTAAVADYKVKKAKEQKIKRKKTMHLKLIQTQDVLKSLSVQKKNKFFVGFCIESANVLANAKRKLKAKHLDLIVAQTVSRAKKPFGSNRMNSWILSPKGQEGSYKNISKNRLSSIIYNQVMTQIDAK